MRDRIIFFVLGALLATLAYFAGDMQLSAQNPEVGKLQVIPKLLTEEIQTSKIMVGFQDTYHIRMEANHEEATILLRTSDNTQHIGLWVTKEAGIDGTFITIGDDTRKIRIMDTGSVNRFVNP